MRRKMNSITFNHYGQDGAFQRFPAPSRFTENPDVPVEMRLAVVPNQDHNRFTW